MNTTDFVVIGAGIAGASVAAELALEHSVCLLEAEPQPGYHATGRSAALFSEMYGNRIVISLSRASRRSLLEPPADFAPYPLTRPRGALYVATQAQLEILKVLATQEDVRPVAREVDAPFTQELCPALRVHYVCAGLYEPGAFDIDADGLHQAYLRRFRSYGGCLVKSGRAEAMERVGGNWQVHTATEGYAAAIVINATGAWADQTGLLAGAREIGLCPLRRLRCSLMPRKVILSPPGHSSSLRTRASILSLTRDVCCYRRPTRPRCYPATPSQRNGMSHWPLIESRLPRI